jgi:hypothetical protein
MSFIIEAASTASAAIAPVAPFISAGTSVLAASQANAVGKYNQSIQNRNAQIAQQEAKAIENQTIFDIAQFDNKFNQLQSKTRVGFLKSGVELDGTALKVLRANETQAQIERNTIEYNSKINQYRKFEEANFATIQGTLARQQARTTSMGFLASAGSSLLTGIKS